MSLINLSSACVTKSTKAEDLGTSQSMIRPWTPLYTKVLRSPSNVKPSVRQLKLGSCNWTIITRRSTAANLQENGWKRKESRCCNGPVKVQTSIQLKWLDLKRAVHKQMPKNQSMNWSNVVKRLILSYRKRFL